MYFESTYGTLYFQQPDALLKPPFLPTIKMKEDSLVDLYTVLNKKNIFFNQPDHTWERRQIKQNASISIPGFFTLY